MNGFVQCLLLFMKKIGKPRNDGFKSEIRMNPLTEIYKWAIQDLIDVTVARFFLYIFVNF